MRSPCGVPASVVVCDARNLAPDGHNPAGEVSSLFRHTDPGEFLAAPVRHDSSDIELLGILQAVGGYEVQKPDLSVIGDGKVFSDLKPDCDPCPILLPPRLLGCERFLVSGGFGVNGQRKPEQEY